MEMLGSNLIAAHGAQQPVAQLANLKLETKIWIIRPYAIYKYNGMLTPHSLLQYSFEKILNNSKQLVIVPDKYSMEDGDWECVCINSRLI